MPFKTILLEKKEGLARITLNRPETRNALNLEMRWDLVEAFKDIQDDETVKAVILTGSGTVFSSGGDIRTMEGLTAVATRRRLKNAQQVIRAMVELEKPVVGAINGPAVGAGSSIALACDLLVASEAARFAVSFVRIGAVPDLGAFYFWPLRVGAARAKELMWTGDFVEAREAERLGLVNRVVPAEKLEEEALALARRLIQGPTQSYAMIKAALNHWPASLETFLEMESTMQAVAFSSQDFDAGRRAFLEKKKPVFQGK
jgi:2-(1,2-epoxy-1,2-dihydrophenyl)acetyl-CoA isomerase